MAVTNDEVRAALRDELIRDIQRCRLCDPVRTGRLCGAHGGRLDALYPKRCEDPTCYACQMVRLET